MRTEDLLVHVCVLIAGTSMNIALNAADKWTAIIIITMIILSVY